MTIDPDPITADPHLWQDAGELEALSIQIGWLARRRLEQELAGYELTPPQYMALRCIQEHQAGLSMSELAESSHQHTATMTGVVDRLQENGLVQRRPNPRDRRAQQVLLTPTGRQLLERVRQSKQRWLAQVLSELPADQRRVMIDVCRRYLAVIEENLAAAAPAALPADQ